MDEIINKGIKENTYNGCNLIYKDYILGINDGWYEGKDRKRVTTDNWIVTSFKTKEEKVNDTIASAATFTPDTSRPGNLLIDEIIICIPSKIKSIFDLVKGSVFDRTKAGMTI